MRRRSVWVVTYGCWIGKAEVFVFSTENKAASFVATLLLDWPYPSDGLTARMEILTAVAEGRFDDALASWRAYQRDRSAPPVYIDISEEVVNSSVIEDNVARAKYVLARV